MSGRENKIPILMYHEIYRADEADHLKGLTNPAYNTELGRFWKQMECVCAAGIRTLTVDELLLEGPLATQGAICLTFDDGWMGNYSNAYPVLREYGLKGTFFVATGLIGKSYYMTWNQVKEMQSSGMSIQSHTITHRALGDMEEKEVCLELRESKRIIEEKLDSKVAHLSLPHGSKNGRTWPIAKELGYKTISTSDVGFQTFESRGPWLKRINIGDGVPEKKFRSIVQGKDRVILGMKIVKALKNALRLAIGANSYWRLYRRIYRIPQCDRRL